MIGDVIETFRITTPAVNQKFIQKVNLRQVPVTGSLSKIRHVDHVFSENAISLPNVQIVFTVNNAKMNKWPPKRGCF